MGGRRPVVAQARSVPDERNQGPWRNFFRNKVILPTLDGRQIGYEIYQQMFYAVEDYVDDPQLRSEVQGADELDLESAVRTARESFSRELATVGVIG